MSEARFENIEACVFDAYGTLLDFDSPARRAKDTLGKNAEALSSVWRQKQLEYTWLRSLMGAYAPFWQVTGEALDYAMETLGIADNELRQRLMQLYLALNPFPDVAATLKVLKQAGIKTAILTNGTPEMIAAACSNAGIDGFFDAILSVDEVQIYKPHPSVYQLAVDRLGAAKERISFQSSNCWDAIGASHFGFRVVWCNRYDQPLDQLSAKPDAVIKSLAELPPLIGIK
ncbi:haloacid dehalogenase type II [Phyllobacterium brassicacearum]|uniref:(S)-2-haloacid dehalogenase n=1 Tax=Phyllobacterium brassicacearum TaxID=314235 RepID=A0A2P7B8Z0_9HYPH|nr:haloacid dehalogenase type II [Phyllobacterium brassicacearum]PSH62925.1 haloacid dehalogenase type II [Phyllobacterium brassicacearum]TDQ13659.1 2-haloacid dehalogenase [Phyllobacterium brassicacearum]